jgi:protein-tyrosine phosphatase
MSFAAKSSSSGQNSRSSKEARIVLEADFHCHLLPGWDDGPRTLEDSLQMARRAAQCGVRRIVVTPHVGRAFGGAEEAPSRDIPTATAALERRIHDQGIALDLVPGAEVTLSLLDLVERVRNEPWLTVGGQGYYLLAESPLTTWPAGADEILFDLSSRGITPIIAHPERLIDVQGDISIAQRLVERGALLQVTARSLVGSDRRTKDCCRRLMSAGLVSLVASDAHKASHLWPTEVASVLQEIVGEAATHALLVENPLLVLSGQRAAPPKPEPPAPRRSWFW